MFFAVSKRQCSSRASVVQGEICLSAHSVLAAIPSLSYFPTPRLVLPGTSSQGSYLHSSPCLQPALGEVSLRQCMSNNPHLWKQTHHKERACVHSCVVQTLSTVFTLHQSTHVLNLKLKNFTYSLQLGYSLTSANNNLRRLQFPHPSNELR